MIWSKQRHTLSGTNEDDTISGPKHNCLRSLLYNQSNSPCPARLYKKDTRDTLFLDKTGTPSEGCVVSSGQTRTDCTENWPRKSTAMYVYFRPRAEKKREHNRRVGCVGILTSVAVIRCLLSLSLATTTHGSHAISTACCVFVTSQTLGSNSIQHGEK